MELTIGVLLPDLKVHQFAFRFLTLISIDLERFQTGSIKPQLVITVKGGANEGKLRLCPLSDHVAVLIQQNVGTIVKGAVDHSRARHTQTAHLNAGQRLNRVDDQLEDAFLLPSPVQP